MKLIGLVGLATGLLIAVVVTLYPAYLNAPRWMAYLAASGFFFAGGSTLARAYQRPYLANACVCLILSAMLVIGLSSAFGLGPHQCTGGFAGFGFGTSDMSCRVAFGLGSVMVAGMLFLAVRGWLQRRATGKQFIRPDAASRHGLIQALGSRCKHCRQRHKRHELSTH